MFSKAILTVKEMYHAESLSIENGVSGLTLMENAGKAVTNIITTRWQSRPITVLCGPGNNGGDGFVIARLLADIGWPVKLALLGNINALTGDAATNARRWNKPVETLSLQTLDETEIVIDALFGVGLNRDLKGKVAEVIKAINMRSLTCIAIDIPSGVHGDSGKILGIAPKAKLTVTFFRPKPGHLLIPGRESCGELVVADIGIPEKVLKSIRPSIFYNDPKIWADRYPWPNTNSHKYQRGHAIIAGGDTVTGAARLAALAARRIGAGLVTIAAPTKSFAIYSAGLPGNLVKETPNAKAFTTYLNDPRSNAVLIGPGSGISLETHDKVLGALKLKKTCVLDADALTTFSDNSKLLFNSIQYATSCVLTPHEGEFQRLFNIDPIEDKLTRTRKAAEISSAVVLLKGPDTVITEPNGTTVINSTGTPFLATAGSGDVLAGMITGLLAQGANVFDATIISAWLHGIAAENFGPGVIAEDLIDEIPSILNSLMNK
ncbi:MAG: bifunctional ADP-dependent NAD(P)H-hydrate dehydratase/NAD(P)H-hydrate epimerase [Magnetovibrio sp.]|nr:bifunctional ADP-dependent NAD(P)H-hydrate dehydratase/NAD(P)H-hydrate epimerase [Magnetovibrio sp.]